MRIRTGAALAVAGMLALCMTDPISDAQARVKPKDCTGLYTAFQNGECVQTQWINPNRVPSFRNCGGGLCYRSSRHKKHR
jgi:hypothetical protein